MDSTEGTPPRTPFLYRRAVAPHWLMVAILITMVYALVSMLISAPILTIVLLAVFIAANLMYDLRVRPREDEEGAANPRDGWTYLRTYRVWSLGLITIASGLILIDAAYHFLTILL